MKNNRMFIFSLFMFSLSSVMADDNRYEVHKKGVVLDKVSGLMWKTCAEGQRFESGVCNGEVNLIENMGDSDKKYNYGGFDDWRVPSSYELETLVTCKHPITKEIKFKEQYDACEGDYVIPTIDKTYFPSTKPIRYWSSTIMTEGAAESISFRSGLKYISNVNDKYALRLVRSN